VTTSLLVAGLIRRLEAVGYIQLTTPFKVASVEFEFTAVLRGREGRALDLVLVVDTATGDYGDRDALRVRQRVEALSRALDITQSRYVLTLILTGAVLQGDVEVLSETCRVLSVEAASLDEEGEPVNPAAALALDDSIRVLLPLNLPRDEDNLGTLRSDSLSQLRNAIPKNLDEQLVQAILDASASGDAAVTEALAARLAEVLKQDGET
jgi:hypothetical protein